MAKGMGQGIQERKAYDGPATGGAESLWNVRPREDRCRATVIPTGFSKNRPLPHCFHPQISHASLFSFCRVLLVLVVSLAPLVHP